MKTLIKGVNVLTGRDIRFGALGLSLLMALAVLPNSVAAEPSVRAKDVRTLESALGQLPVTTPVAQGYAYKDFAVPAVTKRDARGCGKRERVLLASATVAPRVLPGCKLVGGTWKVNQGSRTVRGAGGVDVVPLVSEKSAWTQGGFGWSNAQRRAFMKWQQTNARECVVGSNDRSGSSCGYVLQAKGTGGRSASVTDVMSQSAWRLNCSEAAGITGTLASWGLGIPPAAKNRIESLSCAKTTVTVASRNKVNALPATDRNNPFMSAAARSRTWTTETVLNAPAGRVISPDLFGLHVPYPDQAGPEVAYERLRLWDARTGWEPLEQNRGTYYWKTLDDAVAYSEARGLKVAYVFGDTPPWAGPSPAFPPTQLSEYSRFVNAVVSRYGSRIHSYEVWNEPNLHSPISESVADLVEMTKILSETVRRVAPGSLVLTPSTTMRTDTIVYPFFSEYLLRLAALGWPVDGYAVHTYPRASGGPAERAIAIAQFKQMLTLAGAPNKPIWDSEINYGLGGVQEPKRDITGAQAAGYISQTFIDSVRLGVEYVDWYLWFPGNYDLLGIQLNPTTTETNAAWAWTHQQLVGASLTACANSGPAVVCGFERAGQRYALAYSLTGESVDVAAPAAVKTQCTMNGECKPVSGGTVSVGVKPIRLS